MLSTDDMKEKFLEALKDYPFESTEEAEKLGMLQFTLEKKDEYTALETPFSFRTTSKSKKSSTLSSTFIEEESSSGESTDDESAFYGEEIKMDLDLFVNNKLIVDDCSISLTRNHKYGLVGRNGIGKTTLLKAIRKRLFGIPKSLKIHLLRQDYVSDERVIDFVGSDAGKILQNLGFSKEKQSSTLRSLSGGWRMRAQLAKAIHMNPDLLLLDEPTNFLDIKAINFLESQISNLKTVIIVSHDRNFLNNTVEAILHLDDCKIKTYKGNYAQFILLKNNERIAQQREYENVKAQREHIQSFIDRFRYNAKRSAQAQSRIKLLEKLQEVDPPKEEPKMKFKFKCEETKGAMVELENCQFSYKKQTTGNEDESLIFRDLTLKIEHKSRIVIVGENGMGKSTLLKLLTGNLEALKGRVSTHPSLRVGYFAQHHVDHLDHNLGALALLMKTHEEEASRATLSNFGLHVNNQKIGLLSGGQKSRLAFASISLMRPNLLVLDEPTNHLDMETIDALSDALIEFPGAVVCVSHDLAFIEKVFKEVYICEDKTLKYFKGTAMEYKESFNKR
ncbi:ATP-binding cassette sub- F member 3 [Glugoides intestinalis]